MNVDRFLRRALLGTVLVAVAVLAYGTVAVDRGQPPIPDRVVAPGGAVVFTGTDIRDGKKLFQRADLADFGSLYGNGAYFGPDWGTDYLHRETVLLRDAAAKTAYGARFADLSPARRAAVAHDVRDQLGTNRYADGVLRLTPAQAAAHAALTRHYTRLFLEGDPKLGLHADVVNDAAEARQLTAFVGWVAWTTSAHRPGKSFSYTNNWPYDKAAGNEPTRSMWWWTWASLAAAFLVAAGAILFYRRAIAPAGHLEPAPPAAPAEPPLTPSQRSTAKWFVLVPALLLVQGLLGSLMAHFFVERDGFFGLDVLGVLPYNVVHAWHLQVAIAWVAAAWLGAGLFLAPTVGGREPRRQSLLADGLWVAVLLVVVGSLAGIWLGVKHDVDWAWFWVGNQGLEFIQLGRAFQIALLAGLLAWGVILARAFLPALRRRGGFGSLEHLLLYSGVAIGVVYATGMLAQPLSSATMTDYWRWWVVHLWVEGVFEFFTVAVTAYAVLSMGLLPRRLVERVVYFELILILGSGIVGTGHHFYWVGEPAVWLSLGAMFSMVEVIPLGFLIVRAWQEYRVVRAAGRDFPHRLAFAYFTSAAAWNVLGAGVLGAIVNPPIVNYYEHGTFLTLAHGHAAMFGSFGLLALGLMYMSLRGLVHPEWWSDRLGRIALWAFNGAIVLWLVLNLVPVGTAQLVDVIQHGYWHARSLAFYDDWVLVQWLRLPGDVLYLAAGGLVLWDVVAKVRHRRRATVGDGEDIPPQPERAERRETVAV